MKNLFLILLSMSVLFAFACNGIGVKPTAPCVVDKSDGAQIELSVLCAEIDAAGRTSYICNLQKEYNVDACVIHRGLEVLSKEGLILEGYTADEFKLWGDKVIIAIENGITYGELKIMVLAQFMKINRMIGAQVLILGDMFLDLPQATLIQEDDIEIAVSSINDLVQEVLRLDMWL